MILKDFNQKEKKKLKNNSKLYKYNALKNLFFFLNKK